MPQRYNYNRRRAAKLVSTARFWDVGGGSQGSGTAETNPAPINAYFIAAIAAIKAAGVTCDLKACEGIENEKELFKKLFPAVGELVRVPDRVYNFEVFKVV